MSLLRRVIWWSFGGLVVAIGLAAPSLLAAQDTNRVAIVVRLADGRTDSRCVAFDEPQISGYEALTRAGFEIESQAQGMGSLICRVEDLGCPADDCLCQCRGGPDCVYWSYWHLLDGQWQYATVGAAAYQLSDGAIDGWSWGPGSVTAAVEPPLVTFDEICPANPAATTSVAPVDLLSTPAEPSVTDWLPYLAFGLITLLLVATILLRRRREVA